MGIFSTLTGSAQQGLGNAVSGGISGLVSGGIGQLFSSLNAARDWKYKQKEMQLQHELNEASAISAFDRSLAATKELRDSDREYNSASAVRDRYEAAGINPALAMSSGGAGVAASSTSAPDSGMASVGIPGGSASPSVNPMAGSFDPVALANARLLNARAREIENRTQDPDSYTLEFDAHIRERLAAAGMHDAQAQLIRFEKSLRETLRDTTVETAKSALSKSRLECVQLLSRIGNTDADTNVKRASASLILTQAAETMYRIDSLRKGLELTDAQIDEIRTRIKGLKLGNVSSAISVLDQYNSLPSADTAAFSSAMNRVLGSGSASALLRVPLAAIFLATRGLGTVTPEGVDTTADIDRSDPLDLAADPDRFISEFMHEFSLEQLSSLGF